MRYLNLITLLLTSSFLARGTDLSLIGRQLCAINCFTSKARCEILMPNSDRPVVYDLTMKSQAVADTLSACDYLIDWSVTTPTGATGTGFTAYSSGDHFRYRDGRLQEYHVTDDPVPFQPGGNKTKGVQSRAQFVDFLPQSLGAKLVSMASDSAYIYKVSERPGRIVIDGVERVRGYDCREFTYTLDAATLFPIEVSFESNPGQPSEQTVVMTYTDSSSDGCTPITEESLAAAFPDAFGKYRRDNYSLRHLPGQALPTFSAPTPTGERFTYNRGDAFGRPAVIAVLDSSVGSTPEVVSRLREASAQSSVANRLILAFIGSDIERIDAATGSLGIDEAILIGARKMARDFGVADTPAFIFCGPDGRVTDIMVGQNNNLTADVIQKIAISR